MSPDQPAEKSEESAADPERDMLSYPITIQAAAERMRMEEETARLRQENDDTRRRIEEVRARVRVLLGLPSPGQERGADHAY